MGVVATPRPAPPRPAIDHLAPLAPGACYGSSFMSELWQWVPMLVPFDELATIAGELAGAPLRGPEAARVATFAMTTNPGLVRTVTRRWSGSGVVLEVTEHVHAFSERGETPSEQSSWDARIDWEASQTSLFLNGAPWGRLGSSRVVGACVYRFSGPPSASAALERRWLQTIEREFFKPRWPEHPLVPAWFRSPLEAIGLASQPHQGTLRQIGSAAHVPALFCTSGDPAWGMIKFADRALPIGPLPRDPHTFVVNLQRPSGLKRREAVEVFRALVRDSPSLAQVVDQSGSMPDATGFVSLSKMPDRTKYGMWRGGGWLIRSQLGFKGVLARASRHGAFAFEWAIQSERGSFALFARQTQSHDHDYESLTLCVVARWPRWTYLRHLRSAFSADGWTWMKQQPTGFWW